MNFEKYLQQKRYSDATINRYSHAIQPFLDWLHSEGLEAAAFTYNDLLDFMRHCRRRSISKISVQYQLCAIRHLCNYLIGEKQRDDNPAAGVHVKGFSRKIPSGLLNAEEMEDLYRKYSLLPHVDASKKIMLGLMVYQGVNGGEILRLQYHHVRINEGKVFIQATKRRNGRLLNFHVLQMPLLQEYLSANRNREGPLFTAQRKNGASPHHIDNRIAYMFKQLRQLNAKVINPKQIRNSVITEWLRKNNIRQVQYMAGHKYVSSTERYRINNLDDLQKELEERHPKRTDTRNNRTNAGH